MLHGQYEEGQGLVEYALILVLISIVVILVMSALGERIGGVFSAVTESMEATDAE